MRKVFDGKTSVISISDGDGVAVVYNNTNRKALIHNSFEVCIRENDYGRVEVTIHQRGVGEPLLEVDPLELAYASEKHAQSLIESMDYQLRGVIHE